ncbi:hypothetical protein TIFTF001_043257, partial [Ficus carica]
LYSRKRE